MVKYTEQQLDDVFIALANDKRRGMITALAYRPATVSQLAGEQSLSLPAMHKHVQLLERADLIQRRKVGRTNFVALNQQALHAAQKWLAEFHTEWGNGNQTLENYLAGLHD